MLAMTLLFWTLLVPAVFWVSESPDSMPAQYSIIKRSTLWVVQNSWTAHPLSRSPRSLEIARSRRHRYLGPCWLRWCSGSPDRPIPCRRKFHLLRYGLLCQDAFQIIQTADAWERPRVAPDCF